VWLKPFCTTAERVADGAAVVGRRRLWAVVDDDDILEFARRIVEVLFLPIGHNLGRDLSLSLPRRRCHWGHRWQNRRSQRRRGRPRQRLPVLRPSHHRHHGRVGGERGRFQVELGNKTRQTFTRNPSQTTSSQHITTIYSIKWLYICRSPILSRAIPTFPRRVSALGTQLTYVASPFSFRQPPIRLRSSHPHCSAPRSLSCPCCSSSCDAQGSTPPRTHPTRG
jgi:hypothetical protein